MRSRSSGCPPSPFISVFSQSLFLCLSFPHHLNPVRFINIKKDGKSSGLLPTTSIRLPLSFSIHGLTLQRLCIIIVCSTYYPSALSVCQLHVYLTIYLRLMFKKQHLPHTRCTHMLYLRCYLTEDLTNMVKSLVMVCETNG